MLHAVIMAGGAGTRFWPASRASLPKQLLNLTGTQTMIQATVGRLGELVPPDRTLIVTNQRLVDKISEQLPHVPRDSIVGEPCKRDTAPCIGLAAMYLAGRDEQATMVVMPADHVIQDETAFRQALAQAARLVDEQPGRIVTFGIRPTYPAETFGYIERGGAIEPVGNDAAAYRVRQFREKPKAGVAREYIDSGNFYWNSGIFIWRAETILAELSARQPEMVEHLRAIVEAWGAADFSQTFDREFTAINSISVDYAVMEHATDVVVIEAPFDWDDVGNWQSLPRLLGTDDDGNTIDAKHIGLKTAGSIVRGNSDHLLVTLGVSDCIVVQTPDATLIANKHDEESIRELVKIMEQRGWREYL
ncbi:MAG: mannose-1-phosphate guanylyltransferase [Pirellulales bacterium]